MLKKSSILALAVSSLFIANTANADIVFYSKSDNNQNVCDNVPGNWSGIGKISAAVGRNTIRCEYKGTAKVKKTAQPYQYESEIHLTLISGICPAEDFLVVPSSCDPVTGTIIMKSDEADLTGALYDNGNSANLTGTVTVPYRGGSITANVDEMEIHKQ